MAGETERDPGATAPEATESAAESAEPATARRRGRTSAPDSRRPRSRPPRSRRPKSSRPKPRPPPPRRRRPRPRRRRPPPPKDEGPPRALPSQDDIAALGRRRRRQRRHPVRGTAARALRHLRHQDPQRRDPAAALAGDLRAATARGRRVRAPARGRPAAPALSGSGPGAPAPRRHEDRLARAARQAAVAVGGARPAGRDAAHHRQADRDRLDRSAVRGARPLAVEHPARRQGARRDPVGLPRRWCATAPRSNGPWNRRGASIGAATRDSGTQGSWLVSSA